MQSIRIFVQSSKTREGYIALLSVLVVGAVAAMTILILFVTNLNIAFNSNDIAEGAIARALADGCMERALLDLRNQREEDCSSAGTACGLGMDAATTGQGSCDVVDMKDISAGLDTTLWRIRTIGTSPSGVIKYVEVVAERALRQTVSPFQGYAPNILRWGECTDFSVGMDEDCPRG